MDKILGSRSARNASSRSPLNPLELVARVKSLLRAATATNAAKTRLPRAGSKISPASRSARTPPGAHLREELPYADRIFHPLVPV